MSLLIKGEFEMTMKSKYHIMMKYIVPVKMTFVQFIL